MAAGSDSVLHFFGNGKGESIVLESPQGWGVIDCFTYEGRVPVLEFLQSQGVERLNFLSLTHPHDDHFSGLDKIVKHFLGKGGIDEFWRYPVLDAKHLLPVLRAESQSRPDPFAQQMEEALSDLQRAYEMLLTPIKKSKTELKYLTQGLPLLAHQTSELELTAIAPPGQMMIEAEQHVAHVIEALNNKTKPKSWDLNKISTGLAIKERDYQVVLGGDVPASAWKAIFSARSRPTFDITVLKVPHHGSAKDNKEAMLKELSGKAKARLAVVTRYSSSGLPRAKTIKLLEQHFDRVIVLGAAIKPKPRPKSKRKTNLKPKKQYTAQRLSVTLGSSEFATLQPVSC